MKNTTLNETQEGIVGDYFDLRIGTFLDALLDASQDVNALNACQRVISTLGVTFKNCFMNIVTLHYPHEDHLEIRESLGNIYDLLHGRTEDSHLLIQDVCDTRLNSNTNALNPIHVKKEIGQILKKSVAEWLEAKQNANAFPSVNIFSGSYVNSSRDTICR